MELHLDLEIGHGRFKHTLSRSTISFFRALTISKSKHRISYVTSFQVDDKSPSGLYHAFRILHKIHWNSTLRTPDVETKLLDLDLGICEENDIISPIHPIIEITFDFGLVWDIFYTITGVPLPWLAESFEALRVSKSNFQGFSWVGNIPNLCQISGVVR